MYREPPVLLITGEEDSMAKRKTNRKSKKRANSREPLDVFKNTLRGAKNPILAFVNIKPTVKCPENATQILKWLDKSASWWQLSCGVEFPPNAADLSSSLKVLPGTDLATDILWSAARLGLHAERLNAFRCLRLRFDGETLRGEWEAANRTLSEIEREYGQSLWLIQNRISVLQVSEGLEAQVNYANELKNDDSFDALPSIITHYLSVFSEDKLRYASFEAMVLGISNSIQSDGVASYFRLKLLPFSELSKKDTEDAFVWDTIFPAIDRYETFFRIVIKILSRKEEFSKEEIGACLRAVNFLHRKLDDIRLKKVLITEEGLSDLIHQIPSRAFSNDQSHSEAVTSKEPLITDLLEKSYMETFVVSDDLPQHLQEMQTQANFLISRGAEFTEAENWLTKLASRFHSTSWAYPLWRFVTHESSDLPLALNPYICSSAFYVDGEFDPVDIDLMLSRPYASPAKQCPTISVEGVYASSLLNQFKLTHEADFGSGSFVRGRGECWLGLIGFGPAALAPAVYGMMEISLREKDFHAAILHSKKALEKMRPWGHGPIVRVLVYSLLQCGFVLEAVSTATSEILRDPLLKHMLPLALILTKLDREFLQANAGNIFLPVFLDICVKNISSSVVRKRDYAFDDFLRHQGLSKPSELPDLGGEIDREARVYYLRYLCIPDIMSVSLAFGTSRELEEERLAVCRILSEIDPNNSEIYESESKMFARKHLIQRGIRQVEQSKIYVDVEQVRLWAMQNLEEDYIRYLDYVAAGLFPKQGEDFYDAIRKSLAGGAISADVLKFPKNEPNQLLTSLVRNIFQQLALSPEHGLDCYLSMRVRHGTLSGQMREPVEREQLVTQRTGAAGEYQQNDYWRKKAGFLENDVSELILIELTKFSREYDLIIEHVAQEVVQIASGRPSVGMFNLDIKVFYLRVLSEYVSDTTSLDDFFDQCVNAFWLRVNESLDAIRNHLRTVVLLRIAELFDNLSMEMRHILGAESFSDLSNAIANAKTNSQSALGKVENWFQRTEGSGRASFALGDVVDIGVQSVKNLHPNFSPKINRFLPEDNSMSEVNLNILNDVFFIIFDNIFKHSGNDKNPEVDVTTEFLTNSLRIRVESEITKERSGAELEVQLARIEKELKSGDFKTASRKEGGTGLKKLFRLSQDSDGRGHLEFGLTEDGERFYVDVQLSTISVDAKRGQQ